MVSVSIGHESKSESGGLQVSVSPSAETKQFQGKSLQAPVSMHMQRPSTGITPQPSVGPCGENTLRLLLARASASTKSLTHVTGNPWCLRWMPTMEIAGIPLPLFPR